MSKPKRQNQQTCWNTLQDDIEVADSSVGRAEDSRLRRGPKALVRIRVGGWFLPVRHGRTKTRLWSLKCFFMSKPKRQNQQTCWNTLQDDIAVADSSVGRAEDSRLRRGPKVLVRIRVGRWFLLVRHGRTKTRLWSLKCFFMSKPKRQNQQTCWNTLQDDIAVVDSSVGRAEDSWLPRGPKALVRIRVGGFFYQIGTTVRNLVCDHSNAFFMSKRKRHNQQTC